MDSEQEDAVGCQYAVLMDQFTVVSVKCNKQPFIPSSYIEQVSVGIAWIRLNYPADVVSVVAQSVNHGRQHIFMGQNPHDVGSSSASIRAFKSAHVKLDNFAPVALYFTQASISSALICG